MRGRIEVKTFASDAPYEARKENPDFWTKEQSCREIEGRSTELRCHQGPSEHGQSILLNHLRGMKAESSYSEDLEIHFRDGRVEDCVKITGSGPRDLQCKRHWDDDRDTVEFEVHEVETIDTVEHDRGRF